MKHDLPCARCWLEVDTKALVSNLKLIRSLMKKGTNLIAVLKADAYGLGIVTVGKLLWQQGVHMFAVACLEEAFSLREALPDSWILCMGETLDGALEDALQAEIRLTAGSPNSTKRISRAACKSGKEAFIHCKIDTGLHRIGLRPDCAADVIMQSAALPGIHVEGIYTHLALHSQEEDIKQHEAFKYVINMLKTAGFVPKMAHMLDSIGLVRYPDWQYQAVRIGAMLYGNAPRGFENDAAVRPTVRFVCRVVRVEKVPAGQCVGYDDSHPLERDTLIATLSAGYADGYPRAMSYCGSVEIHGQRAKNIGLICMDQMMVDVTDIENVKQGDEAVLLGDGIALREYAEVGHLNRNECTAIISKRVPRIYL